MTKIIGKLRTPQRFSVLDSWRGICACLVAVFHAAIYSHIYFVPIVRHAWLFVDFFFVLSGFVVSHAYFHKLQNFRDAVDFTARRFGRLWPLHVATLFALVLFNVARIFTRAVGGHDTSAIELAREPVMGILSILANVFLLNSMGPQMVFAGTFDWNYPSWSISVEFFSCVTFGIVSAICGKRKNGVLLGLCGIAALGYMTGAYGTQRAWSPFCGALYGLLVGHFTYWAYLRTREFMAAPAILEFPTFLMVLVFVSVVPGYHGIWSVAPLVFGVVVFVFAHESGLVSRLFKGAICQKLGEWSYSIYLVHALVLMLFAAVKRRIGASEMLVKLPELPKPVLLDTLHSLWFGDIVLCLYLIVVICLASQTYRYIEKPARRLFYKLADTWYSPAAATVVTAADSA